MKATLGGITANQWWIHAPACIYISYYYPICLIKRIDPDSDRIPNFEHRIYSYVSIHSKISRFNINAFILKTNCPDQDSQDLGVKRIIAGM
ncbi:MAG: hypothetical protein ACTHJT_02485 [Cytophaga sp.]|uniref:hypothetical protein n=1 Tax=Cytophaga sp. TaxID=29535 RepID=UPI003F7F8114